MLKTCISLPVKRVSRAMWLCSVDMKVRAMLQRVMNIQIYGGNCKIRLSMLIIWSKVYMYYLSRWESITKKRHSHQVWLILSSKRRHYEQPYIFLRYSRCVGMRQYFPRENQSWILSFVQTNKTREKNIYRGSQQENTTKTQNGRDISTQDQWEGQQTPRHLLAWATRELMRK